MSATPRTRLKSASTRLAFPLPLSLQHTSLTQLSLQWIDHHCHIQVCVELNERQRRSKSLRYAGKGHIATELPPPSNSSGQEKMHEMHPAYLVAHVFFHQSGGDGGPGAGRNRPPSPPRADEPAWLNASAASPPSTAAPPSSHVPIQPATLQPQAATQPQPPSGQTPPLVIYMRVANFALCILMSAAAVLTVIVPAGATPASWVLAFYVL